ncbi:hypothetical protein BH10BAC5_BH10BAC5_27040 [soil metagenome]
MKVLYLSLFILIADQFTKLKVKGISIPFLDLYIPGMPYQSSIKVFDYFDITFIENPGMAFGLTIVNKLFLSLFTLFATVMIFYFIYKNRKEGLMFRLALAFILGGAVGNLIDRTFYGVMYGYAPLFYGRVVDFMHINVPDVRLFGKTIYNWPIFNIADLAVTAGFILIVFGYKKMYKKAAPDPALLPAVPHGSYFSLKDLEGNQIDPSVKSSEVTHDEHKSFDDKFIPVEALPSEKITEKMNSDVNNEAEPERNDFTDEMFEGKLKEDPQDISETNDEMKIENLGDLKKMHDEINNKNNTNTK